MTDLSIIGTELWAPIRTGDNRIGYALRSHVLEWCEQNLEHPVTLVTEQSSHFEGGIGLRFNISVRFETEDEAFHFKTRWWGKAT
ncbi:MAG: hypothetical protein EOP83_14815 [Verrucomicrobiaceae bacterium]|nr:MAG: hypothetical protein EOP83_14815 [Verrucomicrobiaceae bacterium]